MLDKQILLVEDDLDDEELTIRTLKKHQIVNEIVVARDGLEALDYLLCKGKYHNRNIKNLPVIVILDINLPKVNGLEVLKHIRDNEKTKLVPVVILTSSDEDKDLINSYKLGANSYVRKPVNYQEFQNAVQNLTMYWLLLNNPPPNYRG